MAEVETREGFPGLQGQIAGMESAAMPERSGWPAIDDGENEHEERR